MKKLFALTLAVAMVLSLGAVSFAATRATVYLAVGSHFVDADGYVLNDDNVIEVAESDKVPFGDSVYFALIGTDGKDSQLVREAATVDGLKMKQKWDLNKSYIKGVSVVKKAVSQEAYDAIKASAGINNDAGISGSNKYVYFLAFETAEAGVTSAKEVVGEIQFAKSATTEPTGSEKNDDKLTYDLDKFAVNFTIGYETAVDPLAVGKTKEVHDFSGSDGEEDISILDDAATFTVNLSGQGKMVLSASTKFNADVAAKYPEANLDFLSMNSASFNRTGEFRLYATEGQFLYKMNADGTLSKVNASYDKVDEAFVLKTRTLGTFVISDVELNTAATTPDVTPVVPENPNPPTGAIA